MPSEFAQSRSAHDETTAIIAAIREAWSANRSIVPIIGAGLSADSGFPVIRSVVRYLGKLHELLQTGAPFPNRDWPHEVELTIGRPLSNRYKDQPWNYVTDFGWPDRFQLNQDLFRSLKCRSDNGNTDWPATVTAAVNHALTALLPRLNPAADYSYQQLLTFFQNQNLPNESRKALIGRLTTDRNWCVPWDIYGDWRRLIQFFTRFQSDYADALFARLGAFKTPNLGHRYLAFLVRLLSIRTIFTFNFDALIEQALAWEGFRPKVFGMEEGIRIPHKRLVDEVISVIKLHGSTHSLLLDERLDHPLPDDYKKRFDDLVDTDPLLLVMGCSGADYRLLDLINHVLDRLNVPASQTRRLSIWFYFEDYRPDVLLQANTPPNPPLTTQRSSRQDQSPNLCARACLFGLDKSVSGESPRIYSTCRTGSQVRHSRAGRLQTSC